MKRRFCARAVWRARWPLAAGGAMLAICFFLFQTSQADGIAGPKRRPTQWTQPASTGFSCLRSYDREFRDAEVAESEGHLERAEVLYRRLVTDFPQRYEAYYRLGALAEQQGQHQTAQKWFTDAYRLNSEDAEVLGGLGHCLLAQEKWTLAESTFRQAITLAPEESRYRRGLQAAQAKQHPPEEALQAFRAGQGGLSNAIDREADGVPSRHQPRIVQSAPQPVREPLSTSAPPRPALPTKEAEPPSEPVSDVVIRVKDHPQAAPRDEPISSPLDHDSVDEELSPEQSAAELTQPATSPDEPGPLGAPETALASPPATAPSRQPHDEIAYSAEDFSPQTACENMEPVPSRVPENAANSTVGELRAPVPSRVRRTVPSQEGEPWWLVDQNNPAPQDVLRYGTPRAQLRRKVLGQADLDGADVLLATPRSSMANIPILGDLSTLVEDVLAGRSLSTPDDNPPSEVSSGPSTALPTPASPRDGANPVGWSNLQRIAHPLSEVPAHSAPVAAAKLRQPAQPLFAEPPLAAR